MAYSAQPRTKDHWSMRLHVKRPGGARPAAFVVAIIQAALLALTVSAFATGGGLYGCTSACGTAALPVTPTFAIVLGVAMLAAPLIIGALCDEWQLGVALATLPILPALLIAGNTLLAPTNTIVPPTPATATQPATPYATSHFGAPFWLDPTHVQTLLFAFALFALLGWLGWVIGSAFRQP